VISSKSVAAITRNILLSILLLASMDVVLPKHAHKRWLFKIYSALAT